MTKHNENQTRLISLAKDAMTKAYAPYSNFSVGAAILDEENNIHSGCNVENAAYPLGVCAEGSAISNMVLFGGKVIRTILIVSSGEQLVTPCGGCRQKIKEFSDENTKIVVCQGDKTTTFSMNDLLPHSFSSEFLI